MPYKSAPRISNPRHRRRLGSLAAVLLAVGLAELPVGTRGGALAEEAAATVRDELQSIITRQLAAFGREDAKEAESFASPQLQDRFPDPSLFLAMVKEHYAALVKPRSTRFGEISDSPHGPLQRVTVVASDGTVWTAIYAFERVGSGWRISGCGLVKQESQDI